MRRKEKKPSVKIMFIHVCLTLAFVTLSGCAGHSVEYDKTPQIRSGEDAVLEYRLVSPTHYDPSAFAQGHIYGRDEQLVFVEGFAGVLEANKVFENVEIENDKETKDDSNRISIDFVHSSMAAPEPVLQLIVRTTIQGKDKIGIVNEHHIQSGSRLGAFMDMSSNGQKNAVSKNLAQAIMEDLTSYLNINQAETLEYSGISYIPPRGWDWIAVPRNPQNMFDVVVGKNTSSPTHTFYVAMHADQVPQNLNVQEEFSKYVSALAVSNFETSRYKIIEIDFEPTKRFTAEGVVYHMLIEDNAAPNAKGEISYIEVSGYYFIHSNMRDTLVNALYSERYLLNEQDAKLRARGRSFLDSIEIEGGAVNFMEK